ncbi:MAG: hypothetical protein AB7F89_21550 [Pirellulaceae bacterium]
MSENCYRPGDWVIFRKRKHSASPGPRAKEITPEPNGEEYSYCVDKFWGVASIDRDQVVLVTRRGKQHTVSFDDPNLRFARWWERLFYRERFPQLSSVSLMGPTS